MAEAKRCNSCCTEKPVSEFNRYGKCNPAPRPSCKSCMDAKRIARRRKDPELTKQRDLASMRRRQEANPESILKAARNYRVRHPEKVRSRMNSYRGTPAGRAMKLISQIKERCSARGFECTIDRKWIQERLEQGVCEVTGIPFDLSYAGNGNSWRPFGASVDRINNSAGYTPDNCRVTITALNIALNVWGEDVFAQVATAFLRRREMNGAKASNSGCASG